MINPKYEYLREYVERIPKDFETIGTVIHSGRNLIKMITVDGLDINVKRYTIPPLINRIAYAFFRPSKGKRAFVYPEKLLEKGFETPCPIAYIEETKMGLIGHSYFMSVQSPYRYNFCQFGNADIKSCEDVVTAFAEFTARLHEAGILHLDYSPGNILYDKIGEEYHFSLDTPFEELTPEVQDMLIHGTKGKEVIVHYKGQRGEGKYPVAFEGLIKNVERKYRETSSEIMKAEYETFMRITPCKECGGRRLKKSSLAVTVCDKNIYEVTSLSVNKLYEFLDGMELTPQQQLIGKRILKEIKARVGFLKSVGLEYLCLSRATATLSGGEAQRIRLATQIGSGLVGVCYILDEPSIGLHQRDNDKLLGALRNLQELGNTLIVVEHDEDTMLAADHIVDIGPGAGEHGGQVIAQGTAQEIMQIPESITGQYLSGKIQIPVPETRRKPTGWLTVKGAAENNLKNIDVKFPLGVFTCVTGVSGSGKSSLVNEILYKYLAKQLNRARTIPGKFKKIEGVEQLDKVIDIHQSPIGRTPRSNPATYTGVFDQIRDLFASTVDAKAKGYTKGRFSFNVKGGRCEACGGDGIIKIEMHFLPDVYVPCEVCQGKRYNRETLDVKYKGKSIYDVLDMTVEEALEFFDKVPSIRRKIETLNDVGLSYIKLGQPSTTLSGGEAQRIKLATELSRRSTGKTIYILDEPTTGLHFADVHKLVEILQRLAEGGNSVVVIEHNLDVIKTADYIIDIGPEGGDGGGTVIAEGTPEHIAQCPNSYTGIYVKKMLDKAKAGNQ